MNKLKLFGRVGDEIRASEVSYFLAHSAGADVELEIYSKGGDLFEGYAIYSILKSYTGHITGTVFGLAASAGSLFLCGCDKVVMTTGSWIMIHNAKSGASGDADEMEEASKRLRALQQPMIEAYAKKMGREEEVVAGLMKSETWFDAAKALEMGIADEILEIPEEERVAASMDEVDIQKFNYKNIPGPIKAELGTQPKNKHKNTMDPKIKAELGLSANASSEEEFNAVTAVIAERDRLKAQLDTKTETLTSVQAAHKDLEEKLETYQAKAEESAQRELVNTAIADAGVTVSAEVKTKLEKRAKIHAQVSEDEQKEVFADMVLYAKHNGVKPGSDKDLHSDDPVKNRQGAGLETGDPDIMSGEQKTEAVLDFDKKVDKVIARLEKENPTAEISDLYKQAVAEVNTGAPVA